MRSRTTCVLVLAISATFLAVEISLMLTSQVEISYDDGDICPPPENNANTLTYPFRTNVSGIISSDTTWSEANSPYVVTGSVLVSSGVILRIQPGVIVKFESAKGIQIDGELIARGTEAKPIVRTSVRDDSFGGDTNDDGNLTAPSGGDWNELLLTDLSVDAVTDSEGNYYGGSIIEHTMILYGGGQSGSGIVAAVHTISSNHLIAQSSVMYSRAHGVYVSNESITLVGSTLNNNANSGIYSHEGNLTIVGCDLSHNGLRDPGSYYIAQGNGVEAWSDYNNGRSLFFHIRDCTITSNVLNGVAVSWQGWYATSSGDISNSVIAGNARAGVRVEFYYGTGASHVDITSNSVSGNGEQAIMVYGGINHVTDNLISGNSGYGVEAAYCGATIRNNLFLCGGNGLHTYGSTYGSPGLEISNNIFAENVAGTAMNIETPGSAQGDTLIHDNSFVRNTVSSSATVLLNDNTNSALGFTHNLISQNVNSTTTSESIAATGYPAINLNSLYGNLYGTELLCGNPAGGSHMDATSNWWGSAVDSQVQERIYDWTDDSSKGIVDYTPFSSSTRTDTPVSPPTNVVVSYEGKVASVTWNPNPEADVAGYKIYYDTDSRYPYEHAIDVGDATSHILSEISAENGWFIAVTAYDSEADGSNDFCDGHESWFSDEVVIDIVPPTGSIVINGGTQYVDMSGFYGYLWLTFTAEDETSGVADLRLSGDGQNWGAWHNYTDWEGWPASYTEGVWTVYVQFRDRVGLASEMYSDSIIMDLYGPTGTLLINNHANFTNSTSVTLTLSASDAWSEVAMMHFCNDYGSWTDWEAYVTSRAWILSTGDGSKYVYAEAADARGHVTSFSASITLDTTPPSVYAGCLLSGNTVYFNSDTTWDNSGVAGFNWSFLYNGATVKLEGANPSFTFNIPGNYRVTLKVTDNAGIWATTTIAVDIPAGAIDSIPPVANAGLNIHIVAGNSAHFDASSSTDNVGIVSYEWSFGDGTNGSGSSVSHTYASAGTYYVVLTVRDANNNTATDTIIVTVTSSEELPPSGDEGSPVTALAIVAGVAAVAIVAVSYLLIRRRRS